MGALDIRIARALDELSPPRPQPDRWRVIVADAVPRRKRRLVVRLVPVAVAAAALAAVALAWPFGGGPHGTILQRAAAAIGDGPVLHATIQEGFHGTLIDLATGSQQAMHGEEELWYDPSQGIHVIDRFGGVVQDDLVYPPGRVGYLDKTLALLATGYRSALANGTARVLGPGDVDGTPVYWIRVDTQMLPDASDGKLHAWAHDVAVSQATYAPVATRETRDGNLSPDGNSTILSVDSLSAGQGDFTVSTPNPDGLAMRTIDAGTLTPAQATALLGRPMLTAGTSIESLSLTQIKDSKQSVGAETHDVVELEYGAGFAIGRPPAGAYVQIAESPTLFFGFQRGVENYSPPEGTVLVFGDGIGVMQSHGLYVALEASDKDVLLAAARALTPAS